MLSHLVLLHSRVFGQQEPHEAREMTSDEIEQTIKDFGEATRRVIEAGLMV